MDSDGSKKNIRKEENSFNTEGPISDVSAILQSIWIRCCSIFPNITDRKFMEGELRIVLYCGSFLWVILLLYEVTK